MPDPTSPTRRGYLVLLTHPPLLSTGARRGAPVSPSAPGAPPGQQLDAAQQHLEQRTAAVMEQHGVEQQHVGYKYR